jgi:integrase
LKLIFKTVLPDNSPFAELKAKLLEQESRKAFTREQINAIFTKLDDPEFYLLHKDEMRVVLMLGLSFGLRLHDAVCFQWSYIKGDAVEFKPAKTKRRSKEMLCLPIPSILQQQFKLAKTWKRNEYVLPQMAHRYQTNSSGISQDISKLLRASGIETLEAADSSIRRQKYRNSSGEICTRHIGRYSYHSFRHTFCTMAANAGQDLSIIRSMVGHANIQMTEHYTHYSLDSKRQVIESLPLPTAKKLIQTTPFAEAISHLPVTKLPQLAAALANVLTAEQQEELMQKLR